MVDFSHLKKLDVTGESIAEYVFDEIEGEPGIMFAPATDANKPFINERMRMSVEEAEKAAQEPRGKTKRRGLDASDLEDAREKDRHLIARFCARGWGDNPPRDANGVVPEFSADNCYEFFQQLPNWIFDPLRTWVVNPRNFIKREGTKVDQDQVDKLGNG